jgi:ribosome-associated protein
MADQGLSSEALAREIARLAGDKKAAEIVVLDVRSIVSYTDFFVICTGNTERQNRAIQDGINQGLKGRDAESDERLLPTRVEGHEEARWILMDYLDCVVHIFTPEARDFYRLETLWGEVPQLELEQQLTH